MNKIIAKNKEHLQELIKEPLSQNLDDGFDITDLNFIDTSSVTDMSELFQKVEVDFDVSEWDVSKVTDMSAMFAQASGGKTGFDFKNTPKGFYTSQALSLFTRANS